MSPRATAMAPDDRRKAIVDVVVPLLLDHGGEVSTRQIAEAAGIAEGTIFRVFPDKNALWLAVAERTLDPAGRARRPRARRSTGPPTSTPRSSAPPTTCSSAPSG